MRTLAVTMRMKLTLLIMYDALNNHELNILGKIGPSVGFEEQGREDLQNEQLQFAYGGDELQECHTVSA